MDTIKDQASKVSQLLFAADTAATYQKAFRLTWDILRETAVLLWLVICLVFVGADWFWRTAVRLGRQTRNWYEGFTRSSSEDKSLQGMGQAVISAGQSSTTFLLTKARQRLGVKEPEPLPEPVAKAPPATDTQADPKFSTTASTTTTIPSKSPEPDVEPDTGSDADPASEEDELDDADDR
ncbi:uncharacterized protein XM38_006400 [Halomicronema hongdechloris C2206]|uniref:Uncharacterized protein n=1 Tax=Halomicronema hongdechloris C2206 TaxID=1641165 RepID=A0A1Z3HHD8_9CYAN|nr:hypothetical protein [Halomicronema hongdechloris]ASC69711.1 uncharacterized protein XM38_006400 [Halomicronema hongdechloris C2206]